MIPWIDLHLPSLGPLGGFIVAHLFDVVAYQTADGVVRWIDVLNPFDGLSSFGGFAGTYPAILALTYAPVRFGVAGALLTNALAASMGSHAARA